MQKGSVIEYPTKDGDVIWRVQYRDASRRQVKETIGKKSEGWTKRKVQAELAERIANVAKRDYRRPDPLSFSECAERWYENGKSLKGWKEATLVKYEKEKSRHVEHFGSRPVHSIKRPELNEYVGELSKTMKPRTVNLTLTVLGMIFEFAVDEEKIESNPVTKVRRPSIPDYKPRALTSAEARAVESEIGNHVYRLAFVTFELLGLRMSELRSLRWQHLSFEEGRLRVETSKTQKGERSVYVPKVLLDLLAEHRSATPYNRPADYIYAHPERGSQLSLTRYRNTIKKAAVAAGVGYFRPAHDLRVTSLTEGAKAGESPAILMARAGHESYTTTQRYIQLAGTIFEDEGERLAERRLGGLRVIEGGGNGDSQVVHEATS